ncbi:MAG: NAD-dependent epimerase/dehydratase family protein [Clostridia bacterium]|nr:NAD-dependent epimerase/dehydratase family protein [Clostridia bacterium]
MTDLKQFEGGTVLVTGAAGLIGRTLIKQLFDWNENAAEKISVIGMEFSEERAKAVLGEFVEKGLRLIIADVRDVKPENIGVDYIIHAASMTASKAFIETPVETTMISVDGTIKMLEFAKANQVKGFVYLSSMEVYGTPETDEKINEEHPTNLNAMAVRSCYPESKRMCESLCASYASEYHVPAKVVRLTQTFGPGVAYQDGRVFAEFARCAIEGRNIILNTKGETKRNYLYTEDAANALFTVLAKGTPGEAYNAANESTYCSIYEMACLVAKECADGKIDVEIRERADAAKLGYAPTLHMNLDASKLRSLGWKPQVGLVDMYRNTIQSMIASR